MWGCGQRGVEEADGIDDLELYKWIGFAVIPLRTLNPSHPLPFPHELSFSFPIHILLNRKFLGALPVHTAPASALNKNEKKRKGEERKERKKKKEKKKEERRKGKRQERESLVIFRHFFPRVVA